MTKTIKRLDRRFKVMSIIPVLFAILLAIPVTADIRVRQPDLPVEEQQEYFKRPEIESPIVPQEQSMSPAVGYAFRKALPISGSAGGADWEIDVHVYKGSGNDTGGTNEVTVYLDDGCQDFPFDITFEDDSGTAPSWLNPADAPHDTVAHFTIQVDDTSDDPIIYIYWGKAGVITEANMFEVLLNKRYWPVESATPVVDNLPLSELLTGAIADDGGNRTDETFEAGEVTANDMILLPATVAANDAYYFGFSREFSALSLTSSTAGVGDWVIHWEYSQGSSSWAQLTDPLGANMTDSSASDETSGFRLVAGGFRKIRWTVPTDWAQDLVSYANPGAGNITAFWVRARVESVTATTTAPKGNLCTAFFWGAYSIGLPKTTLIDETYFMLFEVEEAHAEFLLAYSYSSSLEGPWTKGPIILYPAALGKWDDDQVGTPHAVQVGETVYVFYAANDGAFWNGIGVASTSVANFPFGLTRIDNGQDGQVLDTGPNLDWDDAMIARPHVWWDAVQNLWFMAYNGNGDGAGFGKEIGIAECTSGNFPGNTTFWDKSADNPILQGTGGKWDAALVRAPDIVEINNRTVMWYDGDDAIDHKSEKTGYMYTNEDNADPADGDKWVKGLRIYAPPQEGTSVGNFAKTPSADLYRDGSRFWEFSTRGLSATVDEFRDVNRQIGYYTPYTAGDVFLFGDEFNAADGLLTGNWTIGGGNIISEGNYARRVGSTTAAWAGVNTGTFRDVSVKIRFKMFPTAGTDGVMIGIRQTNVDDNILVSGFVLNMRNDGFIILHCADHLSLINQDVGAPDWDEWHTLELRAWTSGGVTNLRAFFDGTQYGGDIAHDDDPYEDAGYVQLRDYVDNTAIANGLIDWYTVRQWEATMPTMDAPGGTEGLGVQVIIVTMW